MNSKRAQICAAVKAALTAASPGVAIGYWRDTKPERERQINFCDRNSVRESVGSQWQNTLSLDVESLVFADDLESLGEVMGNEASRLTQFFEDDATYAGLVLRAEAVGTQSMAAGEGLNVGLVVMSVAVTYRTEFGEGL